MVTFEHLEKIGTISADGDKSEINWCGSLRIAEIFLFNQLLLEPLSGQLNRRQLDIRPAAFDLSAQITMTWTNENIHRQLL